MAYQEQYDHPFKFQECFDILSSLPKWKNPNNFIFAQQNKARRMNYSDSSVGSDHSSQERLPLFGNTDSRPVRRNKTIQLEQRNADFARFLETQKIYIDEARESRKNFTSQRTQSNTEFQQIITQGREFMHQSQA